MILPDFVSKTIGRITEQGFEAYAVGGAVRDFLLDKEPLDWDIATSALPQDIIRILGEKNCIPTGIKHGTVTYISDKHPIEITTFRIDGDYADNRHPNYVEFSKDICDDLSRRDFTVNAMAYNTEAGILDPYGGQKDLNAKIIRAVGDPKKRFWEDALRIMRGLRFAAVLGFEIENNTKAAIQKQKNLLGNIAKERLQAELSKLVLADHPEHILAEFADVFGEFLYGNKDFCKEVWAENAKKLYGCEKNLSLRLAVLLDGTSKDALPHQVLRNLKYDNKTVYTVKTLLSYIDLEIASEPIQIKHILSEIGEDMLRLVLWAKTAKYNNSLNIEEVLNNITASNQCYCQKDLAIGGNDLIALGIHGTEIGRILKLLLNEVIEERCENEKSVLLKIVRELK